MLISIWGVVHDGKIELKDNLALPEGSKVLVTVLPSEQDSQFWLQASEQSLSAIWDNPQDDIYAQLLEK